MALLFPRTFGCYGAEPALTACHMRFLVICFDEHATATAVGSVEQSFGLLGVIADVVLLFPRTFSCYGTELVRDHALGGYSSMISGVCFSERNHRQQRWAPQ